MLTASQDIDNFIERQRAQLNNQPTRQPSTNNRQPPPVQSSMPPNNMQDRLDYKVARILDDPPPRAQPQQQHYYPPPPPATYENNSMYEYQQENYAPEQQQQQQQQRRRSSNDHSKDDTATFFNKFGTYDDKRSQLKDDLKREYNEYLQAKNHIPKSKSTSQLAPQRNNNNSNKRVHFQHGQQQQQQQQQQSGKVVAPWEKNETKSIIKNVQSMNDLSVASTEYSTNRSRPPVSRNFDDHYIHDREDYVNELHAQIRELEARKKQLEMESHKLSAGGSSGATRAHYNEDLNALNSLLAERIDQRNAIDSELAHILQRPPVSSSPTGINSNHMPNHNMSIGHSIQSLPPSSQKYPQQNRNQPQPYRSNDKRTGGNENGLMIGQDVDKEAEQAAKKRYQQELQAQMREAQMRKVQEKKSRDDYERKLEEDIQRYNYFGRSGGGAPMRDKDGNVVANLGDLRNPQQQQQPPPPPPHGSYQQQQQQQQQYYPPDNKVYSLGGGPSAITNAPFYNGESGQQYPANSDRPGSPNHARGAVSNGIFGTAKTEEQVVREERYKQDLKNQIEEKRQRDAEEQARRRAEEERELAKHLEWQQQMDRQTAEDAARKQEKETQERLHHQQLQEDLERQKKQEEIAMKRKPKRQGKPMTPKHDDDDENLNRQNNNDERQQQQQQAEPAYRSSSPPIPALKNKGKKPKSNANNARQQSYDDVRQQQSPPPPLPPLNTNDDFIELPPVDDVASQGRQTYRKPPTPRQPDISSARKKPPPQMARPQSRPHHNNGPPMRTISTTSLRSDGSDSEVLNRLEHLKRQLKDKEARLQEHVTHHQTTTDNDEQSKTTYHPPTQAPKQTPGFLLNPARVHHHRESPTSNGKIRRMLQTDDDAEFKPSYFRDDTHLMGGHAQHNGEYHSSSKRVDSASNRMFVTNTEKEANRRRYGIEPTNYHDQEDPTTMANYELNRIAAQNEQRLKKLRDLENDDVSLLDSNEVLERFQQKQRLRQHGSQTTLHDDAWLK